MESLPIPRICTEHNPFFRNLGVAEELKLCVPSAPFPFCVIPAVSFSPAADSPELLCVYYLASGLDLSTSLMPQFWVFIPKEMDCWNKRQF